MKSFKQYVIDQQDHCKIDDFIEQAKRTSRNIPRHQMPQLVKDSTKDLLQFFADNSVKLTKEENVCASSLAYAQSDFHKDKIINLMNNFDDVKDRIIYVTSDNVVLDGNHRVMAKAINGDTLTVHRLSIDFDKAIELLKHFDKTEYRV